MKREAYTPSTDKPAIPAKKQNLINEGYGGEQYEYYQLGRKYVVAAPGICGGGPTIKYTRLDVRHVIGFLKRGDRPEQVAKSYQIPLEAVLESIDFASKYDCEMSYT